LDTNDLTTCRIIAWILAAKLVKDHHGYKPVDESIERCYMWGVNWINMEVNTHLLIIDL
jgi:hypothetical protein